MDAYVVMTRDNIIHMETTSKTIVGAKRLFLKCPHCKGDEVEKRWRPFEREGYRVVKQLGLNLFN